MVSPRSPLLLDAQGSRLLIVDMQEKLLPVIPESQALIAACERLIRVAQGLGVPVTATEQYPNGLGPTVSSLAQLVPERAEKLRFSCAECLPWLGEANVPEARAQVIIAGIETHVCVLQSALDLLGAGFQVFVVVDASGSRRPLDAQIARQRMADCGVNLVTSEMVLFEWCQAAGTPQFKEISRIVKSAGP